MSITEDLLLLTTTDAGLPVKTGLPRHYATATAVVADLALAGRVEVTGGRARVISRHPTGSPLLDTALGRMPDTDGLTALIRDHRPLSDREVGHSLAEEGVLQRRPQKMLGLIPETYPALDTAPARQLRERLRRVLHAGSTPTDHDALLLTFVASLRCADQALRDDQAPHARAAVSRIESLVAATDVAPLAATLGTTLASLIGGGEAAAM